MQVASGSMWTTRMWKLKLRWVHCDAAFEIWQWFLESFNFQECFYHVCLMSISLGCPASYDICQAWAKVLNGVWYCSTQLWGCRATTRCLRRNSIKYRRLFERDNSWVNKDHSNWTSCHRIQEHRMTDILLHGLGFHQKCPRSKMQECQISSCVCQTEQIGNARNNVEFVQWDLSCVSLKTIFCT